MWHALASDVIMSQLGADALLGLSDSEARRRLVDFGPNQLTIAVRPSPVTLLAAQFKNLLIIILLVAAVLSGILGQVVEALAIGVIVLFAVVLGFVQEWRAERALEALQELAAPLAVVIRGGVEREVPAQDLVPGDNILLATGDRVPADARLLDAVNLKIDEAPLTGESVAVEKHHEEICAENSAVGDRRNLVFAGTSVSYGRGRAVVVATGMQTEFGHIAGLLQRIERGATPLQKNLDRVGKILTKAAALIVFVVVLLGVLRGQPLLEVVVFGIALAVAVVPEALPAVVTIALAIGVQRMVKRHALVRHLPAVETLGCTTIICSDKTGTLTKDEMTVRKIFVDGGIILDVTGSGYEPTGAFLFQGAPYETTEQLALLLKAAALSSDAHLARIDGHWDVKGDPTEAALVVAAAKAGFKKELLDEEFRRVAEIPFSSETKRMVTLHQTPTGTVAYAKGAAEIILESCNRYHTKDGVEPVTVDIKTKLLKAMRTMASQALRVIGVAYLPTKDIAAAKQDMIFLGFFGMIDPPRPEAKAAIESCRQAGIKLMMITGDHPVTAEAIARELALLSPQGKIMTGQELSLLSDQELAHKIKQVEVCARVSPEHKLRVIAALQSLGHVVAMTGDGINDAPALKKADIGIAMGITGTDVTKEAAAMTLTDDNFASIVAAVEEGRVIFANIKKFLVYLLSSNLGEIGLITAASVLGLPLPLSAVQILYVNLASDGLPALALAVDPPEADVMRRHPRQLKGGLFSRSLISLMVIGGAWSTGINISLFVWARHSGRGPVQTMTLVFVSLIFMQLVNTYCFRSDRRSVFHKPWSNHWLNRAVAWELILLALVIYIPWLHQPFSTTTLPAMDWFVALGAALTIVPVLELAKWLLRR